MALHVLPDHCVRLIGRSVADDDPLLRENRLGGDGLEGGLNGGLLIARRSDQNVTRLHFDGWSEGSFDVRFFPGSSRKSQTQTWSCFGRQTPRKVEGFSRSMN